MFKADFHIHSNHDPWDKFIDYSPEELILRAQRKGLNIISFTHHKKLIFKDDWHTFGKQHGVKVIPGVELRIHNQDVLVINAKTDNIHSFEQLKNYKQAHPESLIIAPHPFAPFVKAIRGNLIKYIDLFDGVELSSATVFDIRATKRAYNVAKTYNKALFGNTDTHLIETIGQAHTQIPGTTWPELVNNVRSNNTKAKLKKNILKKYGYYFPLWALKRSMHYWLKTK